MSITTIIGSMYSGKTTELIRLIDRYCVIGKKCVIIRSPIDTRYSNFKTHGNYVYDKCDIVYCENMNEEFAQDIMQKYEIVGIDEGFFFKGLTFFCNRLANNGINVIVSSIESSYKQEIFPEVASLIATSENVIKLKSFCMVCKQNEASFNIRTVVSDDEILVGGSEKYKCVCRICLNEFTK
jgi:thymidine kinase